MLKNSQPDVITTGKNPIKEQGVSVPDTKMWLLEKNSRTLS